MNVKRVVSSLLLVAAVWLAGCNGGGQSGGSSLTTAGDNSGGEAGSAEQGGVTMEIASLEEVQRFVAEQKGKVVVLDLWSSSCTPCILELPGLAKLRKEHPGDVVTVTLNLDYYGSEPPEKLREPATKILSEHGAAERNFLSSTKDEDIYKELKVAAVPVVYVYGRDGGVAKRFDNEKEEYGKEGFTYKDHIAPLVKELAAAKGS